MSPAVSQAAQRTFIDAFRHWYSYERDCNAKVLQMLESVPHERRNDPAFARAVGKAAHLIAARQGWLHRLGHYADKPAASFPDTPLHELAPLMAKIEHAWTTYLAGLTEDQPFQDFTWVGYDGKRRQWPLVKLLTQVFGHAWYHRGQIAMLVKDLGGTAVDTDFIFWDRPTLLDAAPTGA